MKFADGLTRTKKRRPPKLALRRPRILRPPIFRSARNRLALFFLALFLVFGAFAADLGELDSAGLFRFAYLSLKRGEATNAFFISEKSGCSFITLEKSSAASSKRPSL